MHFAFDVVGPRAEWALHCSLAQNEQFASWWLLIARMGEPVLLVRDESLRLPTRNSFEVRGPGLWADVHRHSADRWQVNFEGITVALDPTDVARHEVGDLVPVEFEFEWEATGPRIGAVQRCMVDGEAQIGTSFLHLDEPTSGYWTHS